MIKFIYGNPGTGKTTSIYSYITKDANNNVPAILIVPEQMTVSVEREVIKAIQPSAQLNIEVLNFSRLANRLFRMHGGLAYNFASGALQKLLMWRALQTAHPFMSEYQILRNDDSALADAMLSTYKELCACGIPLEMLGETCLGESNSTLSNKIKDITTVCSIYSAMLNEKYTDTNNELSRLSELLDEKNCFKGINVYIDGFTSFTGIEHRIIKSIISQAQNTTITISMPSPTYNGIDTLSIKQCSDKLRRDCAALDVKVETIKLETNERTRQERLSYLSSNLWIMSNRDDTQFDNCYDNTCLELYRAADIYDECEFASATIKGLIESGYRYKDIAIIARNIDKYRGIIEPALDCMDLQYFVSDKTDLSLSPIARLIISALNILIYGWRREDVIAHLKTGLCGISPREADIFESYTSKWNISGKQFLSELPWNMNPDGYSTVLTERGENILIVANRIKDELIGKLRIFVSSLKNATTYAEMCSATLNYIEEIGVYDSLVKASAKYISNGKIRQASDTIKMYDVAIDALDCICDAFDSEAKVDINTFSTALRISFAESELGAIPTTQDEIALGSANMIRTDNVKCVVILGACDGEFPANTEASGLFTDHDKEILISRGLQLSGDRQIKSSDELFYFRKAISAASEKVIIFTRADSEPSIAFSRVNKLIPEVKIIETSSLFYPRLRSLQAISEYAPLLEGTNEGAALTRLINEFGNDNSNESTYQRQSLSAREDVIQKGTIDAIIGNSIRLSQSKAEQFSECKFAYACKYYLNLDDGSRAEFAYNNIGTFIHHVLEKFLYEVYIINKGIIPKENEIESILSTIIENYIKHLLPDEQHKSARLLHLIERLKKTSLLLIEDLLSEFSDSSFRPEFFELRIGTSDIPSINVMLQNGSTISLNGIIDRVDVFRKDGNAYIRVVDYKTGNKTFNVSDISEGLNLQLLLYIFSLTKQNSIKLHNVFGGKPIAAGITYLSASPSKVSTERLNDTKATVISTKNEIKRTGLILDDEDVINAVSHSGESRILMKTARKSSFVDKNNMDLLYDSVCNVLKNIGESIVSGNANAIPKNGSDTCKYCKYSLICKSSQKK